MASVLAYLDALYHKWLLAMSAGPFLLDRLGKWFWSGYDTWFKQRREKLVYSLCFIGFVAANFLVFNDQRSLLERVNGQLASSSGHIYRRLSDEQISRLKVAFENKQKEFPLVIISATAGVESERYAYDFGEFFKQLNFNVTEVPNAIPENESDLGLMIEFKDSQNPSHAAKDFLAAISAARIPIKVVRFHDVSPTTPDFDLFVGPINLN